MTTRRDREEKELERKRRWAGKKPETGKNDEKSWRLERKKQSMRGELDAAREEKECRSEEEERRRNKRKLGTGQKWKKREERRKEEKKKGRANESQSPIGPLTKSKPKPISVQLLWTPSSLAQLN